MSNVSPAEQYLFDTVMAERRRRTEDGTRKQELVDNIGAVRERCQSFHGFVREAWHVLEPHAVFVDNWHIGAICEHLEAITHHQINRLLINVWPGAMKSLLASVMWQAWEWGPAKLGSYRYVATTFAASNTVRDTLKVGKLISSEWYQTLWPEIVLIRSGSTAMENTQTGTRETSAFGSLTSKRGDRLIIDDPHSIETAESENERQKTTQIFREGAQNRLNDQEMSALLVIMQRLHEKDISGVILEIMRESYVHLMLPMEFEVKRRCVTKIGFKDPRTYEGELADPVRFPKQVIAQLTRDMTSHAIAGQYQQRPAARAGGQFKRHWFSTVKAIPAAAVRKVRSWDLAATVQKGSAGDPSWTAGVKMSTDGARFYVEDVVRIRETGAKVRQAIKNTASQDGRMVHITIPQDPGQAGKAQAESIIAENAGYRISAQPVTGNKSTRAEPLEAQAEAGNVVLLEGPWNEAFIDELCGFPTASHDDQFDAAADAFNKLASMTGPMMITQQMVARAAQPSNRGLIT